MKKLIILALILSLYSCNQKVELDDCRSAIKIDYLNGLEPEMSNNRVFDLLGEPDHKVHHKDDNDTGYNYYFVKEKGTIVVYTSDIINQVGAIDYFPGTRLYLSDILTSKTNIKVTNKTLDFTCGGDVVFEVKLHKANKYSTIKRIRYWGNIRLQE